MNVRGVALLLLIIVAIAGGGCSHTYPYRIANDGCDCAEFTSTDSTYHISYRYAARYTVGSRIRTEIDITIMNNGADTVQLVDAYVKVTSHNIPYPSNDRYLPVGIRSVPPHGIRSLTLKGEYVPAGKEDLWLRVVGEEVSVMIEGQTAGGQQLAKQTVRLVPENPFLTQ